VDVAIEAVGTPAAFDTCQSIVAAGGRIANIGVHGKPVQLNLDRLWDRNIVLTTRLVDTVTMPLLLKLVAAGKLRPAGLVTHRFGLDDIIMPTTRSAMRRRRLHSRSSSMAVAGIRQNIHGSLTRGHYARPHS
jgi:alcohol dehydrogenase